MASVSAPKSLRSPALEPRFYLDPASVELEQERIFDRTWQLAGHIRQLPKPGAYLTARAGDQPVLVIRDDEGQLRAFRNVCRHRGSRLLSGSGQCKKAIRCRYHGWTYRLDGSLIGVPEGRSFEGGLDKSTLGLFPARVEVVEGLIFVNLDIHAEPLHDLLGDLPSRLARYNIADLDPFFDFKRTQPVNWKIVADNYLEGYHVPIAHPGLMRLLDYNRYEAEVHDNWVWFEAPLRDKPSGNHLERAYQRLVQPMPGVSEEDRRVWRYIFVWPNTAIDLYPDQVSTWQMGSGGLSETADSFMAYRSRGCGPRTRLAQRINHKLNVVIDEEDIDLVANVQEGMRTTGYRPGPLSQREVAVQWFAGRVRETLGDA